MRIAIAHISLKLMSKKVNFEKAKRVVHEAKQRGAKAVILPSMLNIGPIFSFYSPAQVKSIVRNHAERIPSGPTATFLSSLAVSSGVFIISGPIIERAGPKVFLTSFAVSPAGSFLKRYRKIVLNPIDRTLGFSEGRTLEFFDLKEKYGVLIEGDVLFPEIARGLTILGSTVLLAFPRIEPAFDKKLRKLLEARSIENNLPIISMGGMVKSQEQTLSELPTYIFDPSEGLLEEILLEGGKSEEKKEEDERVVILELQNYTQKSYTQDQKYSYSLYSIIYRNLKRYLEGKVGETEEKEE
ncbi:MAG: carbon-nitrogen hydrolase family protein [Thermoprotei archaeon]|jgi:predicted amidohydrolase|nr:carbon-nitrogen hydrolase family protein [Thermoprotei archaeon]